LFTSITIEAMHKSRKSQSPAKCNLAKTNPNIFEPLTDHYVHKFGYKRS